MLNQKIQAFLFIVVMVPVLFGLSVLLIRKSDDFTAQARPEAPIFLTSTRPSQSVIETQQVVTGTFEFAGGLTTEEVEAVALGEQNELSGAALLSSQDLLEDAGCVTNPGAGQINVPPSAFRHAESSSADGFRFWPEAGYLYNTTSNTTYLVAPVYVPDTATLTHLALVFFDNHPTNVTARLIRKNLASPGTAREQIVGFFSSTTSSTQVLCASQTSASFLPGTNVTSNDFGYFAVLEFPPNLSSNPAVNPSQLSFGLRVYYGPPSGTSSTVKEVVPVSAFRHNGNDADNSVLSYLISAPDAFIRSTGTATPCLTAPVYPPNGATVTEFRTSVRDVDPDSHFDIQLRRVKPDTGSVDTVAQITTSDSYIPDNEGSTTNITNGTQVVDSAHSYYVTFCLPPNPGDTNDILFYGARLFFTLP